MTFQEYLDKINRHFQSGIAREHSYRPALENYLETVLPNVLVTNEPKREKVGAPDFIITNKKNIPLAYIETKDIGKNLDSKEYKEQFDRYKSGLDVLLITDYLEFRLYKQGILTQTVRIAEIQGNKIVKFGDMFTSFEEAIKSLENVFVELTQKDGVNITIKSAEDLAKRMAQKAKLFAEVLFNALEQHDDDFEIADGSLYKQYLSFKQILIGDITHRAFADIYAQTITYGMFAARLHDKTLEDFSRQEAAELIPKSNPFLRKLFQYVASHDLDDRIVWMVDELAEVFRFTDVNAILLDFGKKTQQNDPFVHFYETFLANYDPALRKARGVWYTPEPVVNFIVRAVDEILKTEFSLKDGLADTSKVTIDMPTDNFDKRKQDYKTTKQEVHRVQLLDPATGTGTFLAETVKHIYKKFKNQGGIWNSYVEEHLIPRLHGFELLMASYAMAHIKLDMLLRETGYTMERKSRFKIFLTNTLEAQHKDAGTLFWAQWLADEAKQADQVKGKTPVMVVIGNPPYSVSSNNNNPWIQDLMQEYKKDLKERNIQPLSDDYIKFIRFGQHFVEKNGEGVLAYISNNSFIDGLIHKQMRKSLLETFDKIYILDLHGNSKKKETAADGSADQNVFDIMQGVSINLFVKTGKKKKGDLGQIFNFDLQGKREFKYDFLQKNTLQSIDFQKLTLDDNNLFFVKKNFDERESYEKGFKIDELFIQNCVGVVTSCDSIVLADNLKELQSQININIEGESFENKYVKDYLYRPFEIKKIYYKPEILGRAREAVMKHFYKENIGLIISKQFGGHKNFICFITKSINDKSSQPFAPYYNNPLYIYPEQSKQGVLDLEITRVPNLKPEIAELIASSIGLRYVPNANVGEVQNLDDVKRDVITPLCILDYIYAVLHTPSYREKYKEFLKIDFPRVPFPSDAASFKNLVKLGSELRQFHLIEHADSEDFITSYPNGGDNVLGKPKTSPDLSKGEEYVTVSINEQQYFSGVPLVAWNFYIGGYQPAQKWLKDRVGRKLSYEDILHYQKIIVALSKTEELMQELERLWEG